MAIRINPSDLRYRYARKKSTRSGAKFRGKPDPHPFDRDDLYEVVPLLEAVMETCGCDDGRALHRIEEVLVRELPGCIATREEVFDALVAVLEEFLFDWPELSRYAPAGALHTNRALHAAARGAATRKHPDFRWLNVRCAVGTRHA